MKQAYTLIIIGSLFTIWQVMIQNIDLLNSAVGYLIILLGIIQEEKQRPIFEFRKAKLLTIGLVLLELITPFLSISLVFITLSAIKIALSLYLYFCLIKADYMWHPQSKTRIYLQRYPIIGLAYLTFFLLLHPFPQLALLFVLTSSLHFTYLFYILLQLRKKSSIY